MLVSKNRCIYQSTIEIQAGSMWAIRRVYERTLQFADAAQKSLKINRVMLHLLSLSEKKRNLLFLSNGGVKTRKCGKLKIQKIVKDKKAKNLNKTF